MKNRIFQILALLFLAVIISGCSKSGNIGGTINFLGWEGYEDPKAFKEFNDKYGVTLKATYVGNNDEIISLFKAGGPGVYDIGDINSRYIDAMIEQGMLMPLDESKLPNLKKLFPAWIKRGFGRGSDGKLYAIPAFSGYSGICYRADIVPEPKSWNYWKESPWKEKYAVGGNAMATVYQWAMTLGKGQDARKWTKQDLEEIKAYGLEKWKGSLTVAPSQGIQTNLLVRCDVTTTDDCDCASAIAAQKQGKDVKFALPEGPKKMWVNCYFIFAGSKNSDTAHAWLNNLISTEVAAQMANNLGEAVTNKDAYGKMLPDSAVLKKVGYNLPIMNDIIMKAEFNVLPDSSPKDQYVSLADIYKIFDEIKAKTGRK